MKKLNAIGIKFDYEKYKWFITSDNALVVGGKNAEQNEELVKKLIKDNPKYVVMHTRDHGSPFSIILENNPTEKSLGEAAIFTGCFSRAWRDGKKKTIVDIFLLEQMAKNKGMKTGTFGVIGLIDRKNVELVLHLIKQRGRLRAVPQKSGKRICVIAGSISK